MKWYGKIGYEILTEVEPGVWSDNNPVEREYYGDIIRNTRKLQSTGDSSNDNIRISNQLSIIADPFANENFHAMRYAEFMGTKWKIEDVEVQYPRLLLTLGGVYNV